MDRVVSYYVGLFLKIFSALLILPIAVGRFYGESFVSLEGFILAAFVAIVLGYIMTSLGERKKPDTIEGMLAATVGWLAAVAIGGIPFMVMLGWDFPAAFLEAMSAFSTTGVSLVANVGSLPNSIIFWRAFAQWMGGLGILTFFVTVVIEAGGAATSLISAEGNKTNSGVIRPSLFNAIKALWYVYIAFTIVEALTLYIVDLDPFNSLMYAFTTLPTGGMTHTAGGLAALPTSVRAVVFIFMIAGATNFLLLYKILQGDVLSLTRDYEFRLYIKIMVVAGVIITVDIAYNQGLSLLGTLEKAAFMTASVTSSTGFEPWAVRDFPQLSKMILFMLMFVGGCLGSTTGGFKMLRLGVMFKIVVREIRRVSLPRNALNLILVKGQKMRDDEVMRIVSLFFLWISIIFVTGLVTMVGTQMSPVESFQALTSMIGSMGPLFITQEQLMALPDGIKILWSFAMLAGRLELLPVLVLLNVEIVKRIH
jgi:trk system potassium uptake protein TrkH